MSPIAVLPPDGGQPANYTVMIGGSPCKVAIVGDAEEAAKCAGSEKLFDHAIENAFNYMVDVVRQRGIEPQGEWVLVVLPLDTRPRDVLDESVWTRVEDHLAREPDLSLLYIAMIADSVSVTTFLTGELN